MRDGSPKEVKQRGVTETEMMEMEVLADPCAGLDVGPALDWQSTWQCLEAAKVAERLRVGRNEIREGREAKER